MMRIPDKGWHHTFDDPIPLPGGGEVRTLRDAASYITKLQGRARPAAPKLVELANAFEPVQDRRIYIEKIDEPFLYQLTGTSAEYKAGLDRAIRQRLAVAARER